jgi:hypothetical protein
MDKHEPPQRSPTSKVLSGFVERKYNPKPPKTEKPKKDHALVAKMLADGESIEKSLLAGGYSANVAKRGRAAIPDAVWATVPKKIKRLLEKGKHIAANPDYAKHLVLGRLADNSERGKDYGVQSTKALGNWKGLGMFEPETHQGIIVVVPPAGVIERKKQLLESDE